MIAEGYYREALGWTTPFVLSSCDVILADGDDGEKSHYAAIKQGVLETLGMADDESLDAKFDQARRLYDRYFALADEIVATNPDIVD
jgi:hypothetical protein